MTSPQIQALDRTAPTLPLLPTTPKRATHDYERNGTVDLFAALDIARDTVISDLRTSHTHDDFVAFLNKINRWFSALTTKKLQQSAHRSAKALATDIQAWIDTWNDDPKPFVWHKTAEEILDRLAGYCRAITEGA